MERLIRHSFTHFNYIIQEIRDSTNETILVMQPIFDEGRELITLLLTKSTYEPIFHNLKLNFHQIYNQFVIIPQNNKFYIPQMMNSMHQLKKSWNGNYLIVGSIGFLIGSYITVFLIHMYLPTNNVTLMKAVVAKNEKGLDGINYFEEIFAPLCTGSNDVLIHVKAASVDTIDLEIASENGKILRSLSQNKTLKKKGCFPVLLGRDCTGTVIDVGRNVTRFEIGDEVWLTVPYWMTGTLAEFISIKENYVSHKPDRLDFLDAASLPYSGCIALDCVRRRAGISDIESAKRKSVFVHYGNNAIGCIIIQLCSMYNMNITTSCASHAMNKMIDAGAQSVLLLDQSNSDISLKKYDIIFNTIGESGKKFCEKRINEGGSIIDASGKYYIPLHKYNSVLSDLYIIWLKFLWMLGYNKWKDVPINSSILEELSELVNEGKLYPVTDSVFDVRFCKRAFWFLHSANIVGKPVLRFM